MENLLEAEMLGVENRVNNEPLNIHTFLYRIRINIANMSSVF